MSLRLAALIREDLSLINSQFLRLDSLATTCILPPTSHYKKGNQFSSHRQIKEVLSRCRILNTQTNLPWFPLKPRIVSNEISPSRSRLPTSLNQRLQWKCRAHLSRNPKVWLRLRENWSHLLAIRRLNRAPGICSLITITYSCNNSNNMICSSSRRLRGPRWPWWWKILVWCSLIKPTKIALTVKISLLSSKAAA